MGRRYVFNREGLSFERTTSTFRSVMKTAVRWFLASIVLAILYYAVIALVFSTRREKALEQENRLIREQFGQMSQDLDRLDNVISGLEARDMQIYSEIFSSAPPAYGIAPAGGVMAFPDSLTDGDLVLMTASRADSSCDRSASVTRMLDRAYRLLSSDTAGVISSIPSAYPLEDFTVAQTGASVGRKMNPFYKIVTEHTGLDLLTFAGDKVLASAPGIVKQVIKQGKGLGNCVLLDHGNGYESLYAHLAEINVRKGMHVGRGTRLGTVGVTGLTFAPHLHYEIRKDGQTVDPVHYFFAQAGPEQYLEMLRISSGTGQSLD